MTAPAASIVLRTRNRAEMLAAALESLVAQHGVDSYEIVVVDNDSSDKTREVVEAAEEKAETPVRYVLEKRVGVAPPLNRGVAESRARFIAFCDDDQIAAPDWLARLLEARDRTGAVYMGGSISLDLPEAKARLGPVCRVLLGEHDFSGRERVVRGKEVPSMGNLIVDREIFDRVGLFSEDSRSGGEDTDFTARVRRAGLDVHIAPEAVMRHMVPPHRLSPEYFRWVSLRWGNILARRDRAGGWFRLLARAVARSGHALLVTVPRLLVRRLRADRAGILDARCLLWRAWGHVRSAVTLLVPKLLPQRRFHASLDFSREAAIKDRHGGGA